MLEIPVWVALAIMLPVAWVLPRLLFEPHRLLNHWFGWHYVLVHDLLTDRPSRVYRCRQDGDRLIVTRRGKEFELLEKGLVVESTSVTWVPLTWGPSSRRASDPKPRPLSVGLASRRNPSYQGVPSGETR